MLLVQICVFVVFGDSYFSRFTLVAVVLKAVRLAPKALAQALEVQALLVLKAHLPVPKVQAAPAVAQEVVPLLD